MVAYLTYPYDIPKTYYTGIGQVIARMALVEHQVMTLIGKLLKLGDPKQVRVSFMGMSMKARLGAANALGANWAPTPALRAEIKSIVSTTLKLSRIRNSFAHGQWGYKLPNRRKLYVVFPEDGKDFYLPKNKHYKSSEILAIAKDVRAISKRLKAVIDAI